MATRSANAKPAKLNASGKPMTEAEKAALSLQQDAAFKVFARRFRNYEPKDRLPFVVKVIEFSDAPWEKTETFNGQQQKRMVSTVKVELVEAGMEGIRFQMDATDNPRTNTVQNPNSALNHLVRAATGRAIPESGSFIWDTNEVLHEDAGGTGKLVLAYIARGQDNPDGRRGGLYSELKDFGKYVAPEPEEDEETPVAARPVPKKKAKAAPVEDPELDDVPF